MMNKEHAIEFLQSLPPDQDAVVIMFTKKDTDAKLTDDQWQSVVGACDRVFPTSELWDAFNEIANEIANEISEED